jgi:hypothetical protein
MQWTLKAMNMNNNLKILVVLVNLILRIWNKNFSPVATTNLTDAGMQVIQCNRGLATLD